VVTLNKKKEKILRRALTATTTTLGVFSSLPT